VSPSVAPWCSMSLSALREVSWAEGETRLARSGTGLGRLGWMIRLGRVASVEARRRPLLSVSPVMSALCRTATPEGLGCGNDETHETSEKVRPCYPFQLFRACCLVRGSSSTAPRLRRRLTQLSLRLVKYNSTAGERLTTVAARRLVVEPGSFPRFPVPCPSATPMGRCSASGPRLGVRVRIDLG
jgi:hypothetical protein